MDDKRLSLQRTMGILFRKVDEKGDNITNIIYVYEL